MKVKNVAPNRLVLTREFQSDLLKIPETNNLVSEEKTILFGCHYLHYYEYQNLLTLYKEIFIDCNYQFKSENNKPVIIDCGANIGLSVIYFKYLYPESEILAFEANPFVFQLLSKNIKNYTNVSVLHQALYDIEDSLPFYLDTQMGSISGSFNAIYKQMAFPLKTSKLSTTLKKYTEVDLIKIDVEGAEVNIINDLYVNNLLQISKLYIIEFHNFRNFSPQLGDILLKFERSGFKYKFLKMEKYSSFECILLEFYKIEM